MHEAIANAGPALREARRRMGMTLADVEAGTGISKSTLSRLESGVRRATLELLVPLSRLYRVTIDELVDPLPSADPRVRQRPLRRDGAIMVPLTRRAGPLQAYKIILSGGRSAKPQLRTHDGYEWLYVLNGRVRLILGDNDLELGEGEAAEFDTRVPHWFGAATQHPVEILSLFGAQGERAHIRARTTPKDQRK